MRGYQLAGPILILPLMATISCLPLPAVYASSNTNLVMNASGSTDLCSSNCVDVTISVFTCQYLYQKCAVFYSSDAGSGKVNEGQTEVVQVPQGTKISLTAYDKPNTGVGFVGFGVSGGLVPNGFETSNQIVVTATGNGSVTGEFLWFAVPEFPLGMALLLVLALPALIALRRVSLPAKREM